MLGPWCVADDLRDVDGDVIRRGRSIDVREPITLALDCPWVGVRTGRLDDALERLEGQPHQVLGSVTTADGTVVAADHGGCRVLDDRLADDSRDPSEMSDTPVVVDVVVRC